MQIVIKTTRAVCDHRDVSNFYLIPISDWNPESPLWLHGKILAYSFFFFISDTRKLRAHGATVEIYRTQGQLQKSNSSKFSNLKLRFGQFSDLCSVVNSRHVLTLSRRGWLHFTRGQREISQRAQVRGKQREEREGAPPKSFSFLPLQHWQIRLQR